MADMPFAFLLAAAATAVPTGMLTLDRDAPVVAATVAGQALRLRVALDQHGVIELNPDAAARLAGVAFEPDGGVQVGRVALAGHIARASVTIAGRAIDAPLSSYPRSCCTDVDGEIAPDLLPFAIIRFIRTMAPPPAIASSETMTMAMERDDDLGLFARIDTDGGPVLAMLTLDHDATLATAAGGAALARAGGGRFTGTVTTETRAFGIARPVRAMTLDRPVAIAGFPVDRALVRVADFRGANRLPPVPDAEAPSDIRVVARARASQRAIPAVTLGRDVIGRCHELLFATATRMLTLICARR